jgi:Predicted methyltransferase regulatory domain/PKMT, C-terminal winged helix domain
LLTQTPDTYVLHEHLEEFNEPLYFHQFAERAAAKGLQYLGEARVGTMMAQQFGEDAERTLRRISPDLLHMEQYMDFLRNRMFRQTLLCHDDVALDFFLRPAAVKSFHIASPIRPGSDEIGKSLLGSASSVTNLRLETVPMGEPSRLVLRHLDGSHDRSFLIDLVVEWRRATASKAASPPGANEPAARADDVSAAAQFVDRALQGFARSALLVA